MSEFPIVYRHDCTLTLAEDKSLRELFVLCFKRELTYLERQRFFRELPPHRWIVEDDGNIIAHIAGYDKILGTRNGLLPVIGIAEVCTHPDYRGRGLARAILGEIHDWARDQGFDWSLLFGSRAIYGGSGYNRINNSIRALDYETGEWKIENLQYALARQLNESAAPWPQGTIDLRGPHF